MVVGVNYLSCKLRAEKGKRKNTLVKGHRRTMRYTFHTPSNRIPYAYAQWMQQK
jgi:hypothetical protein